MRWADEDLAATEGEGRRIIEFGRRAPARKVSQYPTWTLRDLVIHVAGVHARTAMVCRTLSAERPPIPHLPAGADAFDWATEQLEQMLAAMRATDPDASAWTMVADPAVRFWGPRMVIETGVHRWDAQGALEEPEPLLPIVARHGLDEFADLYLPRLGELPAIELTATDLGRTWHFGTRAPVEPIEATASALFLRLMSRPGAQLPAEWEAAVDALGSPADR